MEKTVILDFFLIVDKVDVSVELVEKYCQDGNSIEGGYGYGSKK